MTNSEQVEKKIKTYLSGLSPRAVEGLVRKLERAKIQKVNDPHVELILTMAVGMLRNPIVPALDSDDVIARRGQIERMFFSPLDSFLINEFLPNRQEGRINRDALDKVWRWIGRDLMASDVRMVLEQASNSAVSGERVESLVQALRSRSVDAIGEALYRSDNDATERRRMGIELGGERGISELSDIQRVFASESWLLPLLQMIPDRINDHRLKKDLDVLRLVDKCADRFPDHVPVLAAALVDRAEAPAALCAFAGRLTGDADPKAIANSQFAPFVDVVMSEAERLNILAIDHRQNNPDPVAFSNALSDYHSLVRAVERDMDLSATNKWHTQLAHTKRSISEVVTRELNSAHSAVRRALQVPTVTEQGELEIDRTAIDDAVRSLRVVTMVRNGSETFAVNDISKRTRQAVEQTLEIVTRSLITDLGKAKADELEARQSAADVAIMLSEIYFGTDYAAQLRRSRQSAVTKAKTRGAAMRSGPEHRLLNKALHQA